MKKFEDLKLGDAVYKLNINIDFYKNILDYKGYINIEKWIVVSRKEGIRDSVSRIHFIFSAQIPYNNTYKRDVYLSKFKDEHSACKFVCLDHVYLHGRSSDSFSVLYNNFDDDDYDDYFYSNTNVSPDYFFADLEYARVFIKNFQTDLTSRVKIEMSKIKKNVSEQRKNLKEIFNKIDGLE